MWIVIIICLVFCLIGKLFRWADESDAHAFICLWLFGGTPIAFIGVGILSFVLFEDWTDRDGRDGGMIALLIISPIIGLFVAAMMADASKAVMKADAFKAQMTDASKDRKDDSNDDGNIVEKCPYCGKEYPDGTMICLIDNYVLTTVTRKVKQRGQRADSAGRGF